MKLGTRLDPNSFVGETDNLERRLYRTWPLFHMYVFGQIQYSVNQTGLVNYVGCIFPPLNIPPDFDLTSNCQQDRIRFPSK